MKIKLKLEKIGNAQNAKYAKYVNKLKELKTPFNIQSEFAQNAIRCFILSAYIQL